MPFDIQKTDSAVNTQAVGGAFALPKSRELPDEEAPGCWRCARGKGTPYAGGVSIRHDGDRHYIVFTDASGNKTEYRIWFCPFCGKKF